MLDDRSVLIHFPFSILHMLQVRIANYTDLRVRLEPRKPGPPRRPDALGLAQMRECPREGAWAHANACERRPRATPPEPATLFYTKNEVRCTCL